MKERQTWTETGRERKKNEEAEIEGNRDEERRMLRYIFLY